MSPKSGNRFSAKIMLKQKDKRRVWFNAVETDRSENALTHKTKRGAETPRFV
jgi:hypothetical protein